MAKKPKIIDDVAQAENAFPFDDLLSLDYFQSLREIYRDKRDVHWPPGKRHYVTLLTHLKEIHEYNHQHARSFAKRFRNAGSDSRNSDGLFSEIIVYHYYVRLVHEGLIARLELHHDEADVIIERVDGTRAYLEVFCVIPSRGPSENVGALQIRSVMTHTQDAMASIRQKLLHKLKKQRQLLLNRENYAVIELNDMTIANAFTVLSSLSDGYKVHIDPKTGKVMDEGFDWSASVFDDPATRHLKCVIHFPMGLYEARRFIFNPHHAIC